MRFVGLSRKKLFKLFDHRCLLLLVIIVGALVVGFFQFRFGLILTNHIYFFFAFFF